MSSHSGTGLMRSGINRAREGQAGVITLEQKHGVSGARNCKLQLGCSVTLYYNSLWKVRVGSRSTSGNYWGGGNYWILYKLLH